MLRAFCLAGLALVASCSIFTSIDGVSGGAGDGPDGGPEAAVQDGGGGATDAGGGDDGSTVTGDADADASLPNLQPNGGFELVTGGGCGTEWGVFQGNATRVTDAHAGTYACKACGTSTTDKNYSLNAADKTNITVQPGQRYVVEAWVRALDGATGMQTVRGTIRIYATGTTNVVQRIDPPVVPLTTAWMKLETTLDITVDGELDYYISFYDGPLGSCALIDDVVLNRVK